MLVLLASAVGASQAQACSETQAQECLHGGTCTLVSDVVTCECTGAWMGEKCNARFLTRAQSSALLNDFRRAACGSQAWFYAIYFETSTQHQACVALIQSSDSPDTVLQACPQRGSVMVAAQALYADFISGRDADDANYIIGSMTSAFASHAAAFTQASSHKVMFLDTCGDAAPTVAVPFVVVFGTAEGVVQDFVQCGDGGQGHYARIELDPAVSDVCLVPMVGASVGDITTLVAVSLGLVVSGAALVWVAVRQTQPARGPVK